MKYSIEKANNAAPCPYCGYTEIVFECRQTRAGPYWSIWCRRCLAKVDPEYAQPKELVLEQWNRREHWECMWYE